MKNFPRGAESLEDTAIDYKNIRLLKHYITEGGKIIPARMTGFSRKQQSSLNQSVKRARFLALIPYTIN